MSYHYVCENDIMCLQHEVDDEMFADLQIAILEGWSYEFQSYNIELL